MEEAFFFEVDGRRLFAIGHRPERPRTSVGVVLCHPYGEEKQLSYPVLVRFARLLATGGVPVVRFDCRGYGDSDGELEEATLETHVADTLAAMRTAQERLGVGALALLGLRFGGVVAALAAERAPTTRALVLWCPVVQGAVYVDDMIRKRLFAEVLAKRKTSRAEILAELERTGRLEIEGNFLTREMRGDLAAVDLATRLPSSAAAYVATLGGPPPPPPARDALVRANETGGVPSVLETVVALRFWERSAMYGLFVPEDLFARTRQWLRTHGVGA
jgi:exosortase A-associated hydrolase 2